MIGIVADSDIDAADDLPATARIREAAWLACREAGLRASGPEAVPICIRLGGDDAVRELNRDWRERDTVTDVLSFPMQDGPDYRADEPLGDIILAVPFVRREAARLELPPGDHLLHLVVHGVLHLLGHDHAEAEEAARMQEIERGVMRRLGLHDPCAP